MTRQEEFNRKWTLRAWGLCLFVILVDVVAMILK